MNLRVQKKIPKLILIIVRSCQGCIRMIEGDFCGKKIQGNFSRQTFLEIKKRNSILSPLKENFPFRDKKRPRLF